MSKLRLSASLLAAGLLLLAGCGDRNAPAKTADGKVVVRLAYFPNVTHAAALEGTGSGSFAKALSDKAELKETVFTAGPAEIEALFAGEIDLGYIGPGPAVNGFLKSNGDALRIVAGAASGGASLIARKGVAISGIKDLAGKRVAVPQKGGTQDIALRYALTTAGLNSKDKGGNVDVVAYAPADTLDLFRRGELDAAWLPEPWVARLEAELGAKQVVDERSLWPDGKFATAVVIVRKAFLDQHPDIVAAFVAAHHDAVEAINKDPEAARKTIGEQLKARNQGKGVPDAILKAALARTAITDEPLTESVLTTADRSKELGYLKTGREALKELYAKVP